MLSPTNSYRWRSREGASNDLRGLDPGREQMRLGLALLAALASAPAAPVVSYYPGTNFGHYRSYSSCFRTRLPTWMRLYIGRSGPPSITGSGRTGSCILVQVISPSALRSGPGQRCIRQTMGNMLSITARKREPRTRTGSIESCRSEAIMTNRFDRHLRYRHQAFDLARYRACSHRSALAPGDRGTRGRRRAEPVSAEVAISDGARRCSAST